MCTAPWLAAAVLLALGGCAVNPVSGKQEMVTMSEDEEIEIGRKLSKVMPDRYGGSYDDPELQAYVSNLGEKLAAVSHRTGLIYHFMVLDSSVINAFALPGGYVYITRGMLGYFQSEGELAAVLGHEIGHVTARHAVGQHTKAFFLSLLTGITLQAAGAGSSSALREIAGVVNTSIIRGYGRRDELQADRLGAEYGARLGYDPEKMLGVLRILKAQEEYRKQLSEEEGQPPPGYHGLFATHPDHDSRLKKVIEESKSIAGAGTAEDDSGVFLQRLDGLVYGQSAKRGIVRGSSFYHRERDITLIFPRGWKIENRPDLLLAHNREDTVMVSLIVSDRNRRESVEAYMERRLKKRKTESTGPLGGSLGGYTARAELNTPYGKRLARTAVLYKGKRVYEFLATCRNEDEFEQNDALFLETMKSLRGLRPDEHPLAEAYRIKLVRVEPGDTIASLAKGSTLGNRAQDLIQLLNGLYPDGEPAPGTLLKVPQ